MTDVSPLPTPKESTSKPQKRRQTNSRRLSEGKDTDRIDTSVFYEALNSEFTKKLSLSRPTSSKLEGNSLNQTIDLSHSNFGTKLLRLEAENQKLYEKLIRDNKLGRHRSVNSDRPIRLTSSALNRQREQQRIEKENQLILRRLLEVKPSKTVQKDYQMKDYERNIGYLSMKILPVSSSSMTSFNNSKISSKASSIRNSAKTTANNSRVSSAKSTKRTDFEDPQSIIKRTVSLSRRPEWSDRW